MAQTMTDADAGLNWAYIEEEHALAGLSLSVQDRAAIRKWWRCFLSIQGEADLTDYQRDRRFHAFVEGRVEQLSGRKRAEVLT